MMGEINMIKCKEQKSQTSRNTKKDTTSKFRDYDSMNVTILQSRDIFMKSLVVNGFSDCSKISYKGDFNIFYEFIKDELNNRVRYVTDIKYHHLELYKDYLIERYAAFATAYRKFNSLRTYLKALNRRELILDNLIESLNSDDFGIKRRDKLKNIEKIRRQILSKETISVIFKRIREDNGTDNDRDFALFAILFMGLRRSEILMLEWNNINFKDKTLHIWRPKTNNFDVVALSNTAYEALTKYYQTCNSPKELKTKVFNINKNLYSNIFHKYTKGLHTETGDTYIVPHTCRHTFITHMVRANISLPIIQKYVGLTLDTLQVYTHLCANDTVDASSVIDTFVIA